MPPSTPGSSRSGTPAPVRSVSAAYALHFQMPRLPQPTPPSLLKRQASSSSSSASSEAGGQTTTPPSEASTPQARRRSSGPLPSSSSSTTSSSPTLAETSTMAMSPYLPSGTSTILRPAARHPGASTPVVAERVAPPSPPRRATPIPHAESPRTTRAARPPRSMYAELDREVNEFEAGFGPSRGLRIAV